MKSIHKYEIPQNSQNEYGETELRMPEGCEIVYVGAQHGVGYVWALVDLERPVIAHAFAIIGTGIPLKEDFDKEWCHVGTYFLGPFVWHLFMWDPR